MKKTLLALVASLTMCLGMAMTVLAADTAESAKVIKVNEPVTSALEKKDSMDWYAFETTKQGYFVISLSTEAKDKVGKGWKAILYAEDAIDELYRLTGVTTSGETIKLPLAVGKYYIEVTPHNGELGEWAPSGIEYKLTVTETEDKDWEIEKNDDVPNANAIVTNHTYNGNLISAKDEDWYLFEITKQGYFEVTMAPEEGADDDTVKSGWHMYIYKDGDVDSFEDYGAIKSSTVSMKMAFDKGKYLVKVNANFAMTATAPTATYNLTVKEVEDDAWEIEDNDTSEKATAISTGKEYFGNLYRGVDVDYFKFTIPKGKGQKVSVTLDTKKVTDPDKMGMGWKWQLLDGGDKEILKAETGGIGIKKTTTSNSVSLKEGTYYLKLENFTTPSGVDKYNPYCIKINVEDIDCGWITVDGKSYWYEHGDIQGTSDDPQGVLGDGTVRGREICDNTILDEKGNGTWFWLDAVYDGAKACSKEVWMPYIYQDEKNWDDDMIDTVSKESGDMAEQVKKAIKAAKDGVTNSSVIGKWVRYDKDGKMIKGWYTVKGDDEAIYPDQKGNTYYYDFQTGLMAKGTVTIDGKTYNFDPVSGVLQE